MIAGWYLLRWLWEWSREEVRWRFGETTGVADMIVAAVLVLAWLLACNLLVVVWEAGRRWLGV